MAVKTARLPQPAAPSEHDEALDSFRICCAASKALKPSHVLGVLLPLAIQLGLPASGVLRASGLRPAEPPAQRSAAAAVPEGAHGRAVVTERRARVELAPPHIDPESGHARLGCRHAEALFKEASGGATLYQLRHSALTHAAENGTSMLMINVRSGHTSDRSLLRYARPSTEALQHH